MTEFHKLIQDAPNFVSMERGELVAYAYGMFAAGTKANAENAKLREDLEFERSENGWVREFLNRMGQKCGTEDCPSLVAYVTKLETDNAKLREQMERLVTLLRVDCDIDASWDGLRRFWSIGLTEDGCLMRDRACKAEAENAKLQELVEDMLSCIEIRAAWHRPPTEEMYEEFAQRAGELGVEVNDV